MSTDPWLVHLELDDEMDESDLAQAVRDHGGAHVQGVYGAGDRRHYIVHLHAPAGGGGHPDPVEAIKQGLPSGGTFSSLHWCA
jgi:hypothetical protein